MVKFYGNCQTWSSSSLGTLIDPTDVPDLPIEEDDFKKKLFLIKGLRSGTNVGLGLWVGYFFSDSGEISLEGIDKVLEVYDHIREVNGRLGLKLLSLSGYLDELPIRAVDFSDKSPLTQMAMGIVDIPPQDFIKGYTKVRGCYVVLESLIKNRYNTKNPFENLARVLL